MLESPFVSPRGACPRDPDQEESKDRAYFKKAQRWLRQLLSCFYASPEKWLPRSGPLFGKSGRTGPSPNLVKNRRFLLKRALIHFAPWGELLPHSGSDCVESHFLPYPWRCSCDLHGLAKGEQPSLLPVSRIPADGRSELQARVSGYARLIVPSRWHFTKISAGCFFFRAAPLIQSGNPQDVFLRDSTRLFDKGRTLSHRLS